MVTRRKDGGGAIGEVEVVADVSRFDTPPSPRGVWDVEYEQSETVVWFEWKASAGYRYHIDEVQPQLQQERAWIGRGQVD